MTPREQILQDAMSLAPEDRAFVVGRLEESLEKGGFVSPEIATAWAHEIRQRVAAYERGDIRSEDSDVVLRRMRGYLAEHRQRKAEL